MGERGKCWPPRMETDQRPFKDFGYDCVSLFEIRFIIGLVLHRGIKIPEKT